MKSGLLIVLLLIAMVSCNMISESKDNNMKKKKEWFENGKWRAKLAISPDESIDIEKFYEHYNHHRKLWNKVFNFLNHKDLIELEPGRYDLAGDSTYAVVQEYTTKNEDETEFEAHKKYIDLQYLIYGEEKIGVATLSNNKTLVPYNENEDISFYDITDSDYRHADPEVFFIFFPEDAHRPCVRTNNNIKVKKIVFKILSE